MNLIFIISKFIRYKKLCTIIKSNRLMYHWIYQCYVSHRTRLLRNFEFNSKRTYLLLINVAIVKGNPDRSNAKKEEEIAMQPRRYKDPYISS